MPLMERSLWRSRDRASELRLRKQNRRTAYRQTFGQESSRSQVPFRSQLPPRVPGLPGARWSGKVLWESGGTNANGVITDTAGNPLVTEFFSPSQQTYQPHFWTGNPITSDQQVQIYEEMVLDPQGQLTTSFLSLDNKVKDNRILPQGRSSSGPNADITAPVGTGADPNYQRWMWLQHGALSGTAHGSTPSAAKVQATLYYQSIPPSYLRQRAQDAHGPDTARLIKFTNQLDVNKYTEISNWKLKVASSGPAVIQ